MKGQNYLLLKALRRQIDMQMENGNPGAENSSSSVARRIPG